MQNVTDRVRNPFGMEPPCAHRSSAGVDAVYGYGDANADFHVIGDHPGVHGGAETGVPFTGTDAGAAIQELLAAVDLLESPGEEPVLAETFLSYLHMCCPPAGKEPTPAAYADLERFFDAELRAIAAHVLVPVGERATVHVLRNYTAESLGPGNGTGATGADFVEDGSERPAEALDMDAYHATEVKGSGWLVFPLRDPAEWTEGDHEAALEAFEALLARDYRQTTDLGRFLATDDPYLVR